MWQLQLILAVLLVTFVAFLIFTCGYLVTRLYFVIGDIRRKRNAIKFGSKRRKTGIKTMIIAGSGGHTTEILQLAETLTNSVYSSREYVVASTDQMSKDKIHTSEKNRNGASTQKKGACSVEEYSVRSVPRSREVKQSYFTSVFTTLYASVYSLPLVFTSRPDLILCNGPGTCVPLCVAGFMLTVMGVKKVMIIYIESFCRVNTLSLSGQILYYFADHVLVQWPELQEKYPHTRYIGQLV